MFAANSVHSAFVNLSGDLFRHQFETNYFFDRALLNDICQHLGLERAVLMVYDEDMNFKWEINQEGTYKNTPQHFFHHFSKVDPCSRHINKMCMDGAYRPNRAGTPLFRSSDILGRTNYVSTEYVQYLNENFGFGYSVALPFGPGGRFHLAAYKRLAQGDFSDREMDVFANLYNLLESSYGAFEQLQLQNAVHKLQSSIPKVSGGCEIILDDKYNVLSCCGQAAERLAVLYRTSEEALVGSNLNFVELLFGATGEIASPCQAEYKDQTFYMAPFYLTDDLEFTKKFYRLMIAPKCHTKQIVAGGASALVQQLTPKEKEVAREIADGATYREVATHLSISVSTVRNHIQHIYQKLNINNQRQLVNLYRNCEMQGAV